MDPRTIDKLGTEAWTTKVEPAIERALRLLSDDELEAVARLIGYGEDKMEELIALYKAKAMNVGMWYDPEGIMAVYHQGRLDTGK